MKIKLDKYEIAVQDFEKQKALYPKATNWDAAFTGSTVYRDGQAYLVGRMKRVTIGDQLRNRQSLKTLIYVTNCDTCSDRAITLSQWIDEKWTTVPN